MGLLLVQRNRKGISTQTKEAFSDTVGKPDQKRTKIFDKENKKLIGSTANK